MKKIFFFILALAVWISGCRPSSSTQKKEAPEAPRYIFYFIGDGFGYAQTHLAEGFLAQKKGQVKPEKLLMSTFPVHGSYTTYAENRFITGSAAAGTALAAGHKTSINTICMNAERTASFKSLAEMLRDKGMKIGIVTSVSIDHATPAVFYAHQPKRNMYYDIADELPESNFNYFAGGGFKDPFGKRKGKSSSLGNMGLDEKTQTQQKKSYPSIYKKIKSAGYRIVKTKEGFDSLKNGDDKIIVCAPTPAGGASLPYVIDQTNKDFTLSDYTRKGIELLDNSKGFFLMVEGGKIDWACHANDAATTVHEVLQFDDAVKTAYEFYKKHPKETLIVVCSDHETGGLTLGHAVTGYETNLQLLQHQNISCEAFTDKIDSIKKKNRGKCRYADVYPLLQKHFGFDRIPGLELSKYDIEDLKQALKDDKRNSFQQRREDARLECAYGPYDPVTTVACRLLNHKSGLDFTTFSHTALPCPTHAVGAGSETFLGFYDNTEIPSKIMQLFGLSPEETSHKKSK